MPVATESTNAIIKYFLFMALSFFGFSKLDLYLTLIYALDDIVMFSNKLATTKFIKERPAYPRDPGDPITSGVKACCNPDIHPQR